HTKAGPHPSARPAATRQPTAEERRRSQRVLVRMPVVIHVNGKKLEGNTHTVSAGGAMVILKEGIGEGTKVTVENPATKNKVEGKVGLSASIDPFVTGVPRTRVETV